MLLKVPSGSDEFVTEKYHDEIAAILAQWSAGMLRSPRDMSPIANTMRSDFLGSRLGAADFRLARSSDSIEIFQNQFSSGQFVGKDAFLPGLQSTLAGFSKILTAEFQIIEIAATSTADSQFPDCLQTRVRYELVGTGSDFYREQRVGDWDMKWRMDPSTSATSKFRLQNWSALRESRSRSQAPVFVDISGSALDGIASYSAQLRHGTDHWRTVLDGACGIDIYGHNGVSVADIDNDGFDDLYVCQPAGLPNRLYRNRGDGTFEDVTEASGLGVLENTACALFADFDNDGRQDVVVVRANGPLLFLNQGAGKFRRQPDAFKFANPPQGTFTGASVADYDRDGWLDIYFCLYVYYQGTDQYKYPVPYFDAGNGPPNFMMRNNRDGTFRDVTAEAGLNRNNTRYSFCCGWSDFTGDGWPDLYVVNDFGRKNLYRNNKDGSFTDIADEAGAEDIGAGMSVCCFDYDQSGTDDLYVADMWTAAGLRVSGQEVFKQSSPKELRRLFRKHAMGNSLFRNESSESSSFRNEIRFRDMTEISGTGIGRWSWSSDALDFDHDGFPDLYIVNGMVSGSLRDDLNSFFWRQVVANSPDQAQPSPQYEQGWSAINELIRADQTWSGYERNVFYTNNRDGTFSDISAVVGLDFVEDGRVFALADFDHDGRQEIFLKNRNGPQLRILKNVMERLPPAMAFRLRGTKSNRDAIGASVTVQTASGRQTRQLQAGSGFLSQHSKELFFGLGDAKGPVEASIRWPSGLVQVLRELPADHRIWVEEGSQEFRIEPFVVQEFARNHPPANAPQQTGALPDEVETWLLVPVTSPDFSLASVTGQVHKLAGYRGKLLFLNFWSSQSENCLQDLKLLSRMQANWGAQGVQLLTVNVDPAENADKLRALARARKWLFPILLGTDDVIGTYNLLYRHLFDRHRDLGLPTSFLINDTGKIVKLYQGALEAGHVEHDFRHIPGTDVQRLTLALPFPGVSDTFEFGRNNLSYGSVFFQRGYYDQAAAWFQLALRDDPSSAEACYGLGSSYLNLQRTAEARETLEHATTLHASYPDTLPNAWNNLGLLSTREEHFEEAINYFQKALEINPDHLIALNNLGSAYRQKKNWDAAGRAFQQAIEISPDDADANYGLGMVFAATDNTAKAYEYLQRSLKSRPDYPEALNNLGVLYLRTQRRDEAVASFEICIRLAPDFDQAYLNLARVYAIEDAPEKARRVLLDLLKQHPDQAQARKMLAQLPR